MGLGFFESEILESQVFWMLILGVGLLVFKAKIFLVLQVFLGPIIFPGHLVLIIRFFGFMFRFLLLIVGL